MGARERTWTDREKQVIREKYSGPWPDLLRALPGRSKPQIYQQAAKLGVPRLIHDGPAPSDDLIATLRQRRVDLAIRVKALAGTLEIDPNTLRQWECCAKYPGVSKLRRWAAALGMKVVVVPVQATDKDV